MVKESAEDILKKFQRQAREADAKQHPLCGYCNKPIRPGQAIVPGSKDEILHLGCAIDIDWGNDLMNEFGDST